MAVFDKNKGTKEDISFNSFFGSGISMKGTLNFRGTIRFDGKFEGEIKSDDTLVVGENGIINAKIKTGYLTNSGKIVGDVKASRSIAICAESQLRGNIQTPDLNIHSGARFDGNCEMLESKEPIASHSSDRDVSIIGDSPSISSLSADNKGRKIASIAVALIFVAIFSLWIFSGKVNLGRVGRLLGFYTPNELIAQGMLFYDAGKEKEAFTKFKKASFMNFDDHKLHFTLAKSFDGLEKDREALSEYKKAVALNSAYRDDFIRFLIRMEFDEEAIVQIKLFLAQNEGNIKSHFELVGLYKKLLMEDELYKEYTSLVKLVPNHEETIRDMIRIEVSKGWNDKALESYSKLVEIDSRDPEIHLAYGNLLFLNGREREASMEFSNLARLLPGHIEVENNRGFNYIDSKLFSNAQKAFAIVLGKEDNNLRARYGQIMVLAKRWRITDAIAEAEKLLEVYPEAAPVLNRLAWLYYVKGINIEKAVELSRKAVNIYPASARYLDTLADLYYKGGNKEQAIETISKAIDINPGSTYYKGKLTKYKAK